MPGNHDLENIVFRSSASRFGTTAICNSAAFTHDGETGRG